MLAPSDPYQEDKRFVSVLEVTGYSKQRWKIERECTHKSDRKLLKCGRGATRRHLVPVKKFKMPNNERRNQPLPDRIPGTRLWEVSSFCCSLLGLRSSQTSGPGRLNQTPNFSTPGDSNVLAESVLVFWLVSQKNCLQPSSLQASHRSHLLQSWPCNRASRQRDAGCLRCLGVLQRPV